MDMNFRMELVFHWFVGTFQENIDYQLENVTVANGLMPLTLVNG